VLYHGNVHTPQSCFSCKPRRLCLGTAQDRFRFPHVRPLAVFRVPKYLPCLTKRAIALLSDIPTPLSSSPDATEKPKGHRVELYFSELCLEANTLLCIDSPCYSEVMSKDLELERDTIEHPSSLPRPRSY
jgi:hypothetical protein